MKNKRGNSTIIIVAIVVLLAFAFGWFRLGSLLNGDVRSTGSCSNFKEDNEKISFDVIINSDAYLGNCFASSGGHFDTGYLNVMTCGDYDYGRRTDLFYNRELSSFSSIPSSVSSSGISAYAGVCSSNSPSVPFTLTNLNSSCKMVYEGELLRSECKFFGDLSASEPVAFLGGSIVFQAHHVFYKKGYAPVQEEIFETSTSATEENSIPETEDSISSTPLGKVSESKEPSSLAEWLSNIWNKFVEWLKS